MLLLILSILLLIGSDTLSASAQTEQTYWLGRSVGTEYVFDIRLPADFANMLTATGPEYANFRDFPKPSTQVINGETYSFVTTEIKWDLDLIDRGTIAFARDGRVENGWWFNMDTTSAEWNSVAQEMKAQATESGTWKEVELFVLISPNAEAPTVRVPIPETILIKNAMIELGKQTQPGLYFPSVSIPADLSAFQNQMLAYGNVGRRDPDFRKNNGSETATDLSADTVSTISGTNEKVFRQNETPPYFADHVLNADLNKAAQFQAEYQASISRTTHDGPSSFVDPQTGQTVNLLTLGDRANYFAGVGNVVEAAGSGGLDTFPHGWMVSETHFRPWFNVDQCYPEIGYGVARSANGTWYYAAVPNYNDDCLNAPAPTPTASPAPTAEPPTPTPAASLPPALPEKPILTCTWGDVHIRTPDGMIYDFQATGDFILANASSGDVILQARQEWYASNPKVSINTAVALNVAGDKLEFYVKPERRFYLNGVPTDFPTSQLTLPQGGIISPSGDDFTIVWPDGHTGARVVLVRNNSHIDAGLARLSGSHTYEGVCGNHDGNKQNDMQLRGGSLQSMPATHAQLMAFGDSWRVQASESLFTVATSQIDGWITQATSDVQLVSYNLNAPSQTDGASAPLTLLDFDPAERAAAEQACKSAGISEPIALATCTYDVAATGDQAFVESAQTLETDIAQLPPAERVSEPAVPSQGLPVSLPSGMVLAIGQQYAVPDVPGTFRYFQFTAFPTETESRATLSLCPDGASMGLVVMTDILTEEAALEQGLVATNEPCFETAAVPEQDVPDSQSSGVELEIGQQYAVREGDTGNFNYLQLQAFPTETESRATMAFCPDLEALGLVVVTDILDAGEALAQGLTPLNEPCEVVAVAEEAVVEAETEATDTAEADDDTNAGDTDAGSVETGGLFSVCGLGFMPVFFLMGVVGVIYRRKEDELPSG